jgi:hypothetical protein
MLAISAQPKFKANFLKCFGRGAEVKLAILELLLRHVCLHLSALHKFLKDEKGIKIAIGTLHKYIKELMDAEMLRCEKGVRYNITFFSLSETAFRFIWMLRNLEVIEYEVNPHYLQHLKFYLDVVKPYWNNITIYGFWGGKRRTLGQYAPLLSLMLTSIGVDPYKQIEILNNLAKRIGIQKDKEIEISLGQVNQIVEEELDKIDRVLVIKFQKLRSDANDIKELRRVLEERLSTVAFVTVGEWSPEIKERLEEIEKVRKEFWRNIWETYISPNFE